MTMPTPEPDDGDQPTKFYYLTRIGTSTGKEWVAIELTREQARQMEEPDDGEPLVKMSREDTMAYLARLRAKYNV